MADVKRILSKKKPTAKDTLTVLLYDLTQKQADKPGIDQEQYREFVLRLSERERIEHEKSANLYNFLFSLPGLTAEKEARTVMLIQFLNYCLLLSDTLLEQLEQLKVTLMHNFIDLIAENIRAINGYNYLISCLEEYAPDISLKRLYVKFDDINEQLKELKKATEKYHEEIQASPYLLPVLNLITQGYFNYNTQLADNVKDRLRATVINDLAGFSNVGTIENTRYLMERAKEDD